MKCVWKAIEGTADSHGWRVLQCERCGKKTGLTPHKPERIVSPGCRAIPLWHEWGHWLAIFLELFGLSKARWAWLNFRLGLTAVPTCNCEAREAWLNTLGGRLSKRTDRLGKWLYRLLVRQR